MIIQPIASTGAARTDERSNSVTAAAKPATDTSTTGKLKSATDGAEPTSGELKEAVKQLNQSITQSSQDLQFSVDEDTKRTVVKLIDRNTLEVLRQMPSKEALEISKSLDKAIGKLIDQHA